MTRDDREDGGGERYLRALGRDVDVDEDRLDDPETRLLTLSGPGGGSSASPGAGSGSRNQETRPTSSIY